MGQKLSEEEVERLSTALDQLVDQGDAGAARAVTWISYTLTMRQAELSFDQRQELAQLAGRAAQRSGTPSLALLAGRLLDPILWAVGRGEEELGPEYLEHLNDIRRRLANLTARHSL